MKLEIELDVPKDAIDKTLEAELTRVAKETAVLQLFSNGKISSGRGARILGMGRIQFLDFLRQRDVPFTVELDEEDFRVLDERRPDTSKTDT
jgi:predicted HTH domain antitoxin